MVKLRLEGCSFIVGVQVDKPLLSAEMVTGGVYMAQCCILAAGNTATVRFRFLQPQATDMRGEWEFILKSLVETTKDVHNIPH